jgi:HEAT repeat protein
MTVGELRLRDSLAQVRPLLNDPDESVRIAAVFALAENAAPVNRDPLAQALMSGPMRARSQAAFILGELGDESAIPLLRDAARRLGGTQAEMFSAAQRRILRLQIAEALARLGESDALHTLRAALYPSSPDEFEATALAIQILGRLKDEDSVAQLIQLVEYTTPDSPRGADVMHRIYVYPPEVRLAAASSLAEMGYPDGAYVGRQYEQSPDEALRAQVAFLYGVIAGPDEVARLQAMLDDPSILVRIQAAAGVLRALSG